MLHIMLLNLQHIDSEADWERRDMFDSYRHANDCAQALDSSTHWSHAGSTPPSGRFSCALKRSYRTVKETSRQPNAIEASRSS